MRRYRARAPSGPALALGPASSYMTTCPLFRRPTPTPDATLTWYSQMYVAAAYTSGSSSLSHRALGSIHSAETGPLPPPLTIKAESPLAATLAACAADRMSIQSRHGRSAWVEGGAQGLRSLFSAGGAAACEHDVSPFAR